MNMRFMSRRTQLLIVVVVVAVALLFLIPMWWNIIWATWKTTDIFSFPPRFTPGPNLLENFAGLQARVQVWRSFGNSLIVSISIVIGACTLCTLAGFAFAKYRFRFRNVLFVMVLATFAVPNQILTVPLFIIMSRIGWIDTLQALIIPALIPSFGVLFMRVSAATALPDELLEAARMDGANELVIFFKIAVPSLLPSLATLAILVFGSSWGGLFWPLIALRSSSNFTLPLTLNSLIGNQQIPYDQIMSGSLLMLLPPLALFLFMQRYFVKTVFLTGFR